jgi:hypothetical protein
MLNKPVVKMSYREVVAEKSFVGRILEQNANYVNADMVHPFYSEEKIAFFENRYNELCDMYEYLDELINY